MSSQKTALDVTFSVVERVVAQVAQFTVFVVAARILGPAEFGFFAMASAVAILLLRTAEAGWAPFIMSRAGDITVPLQVLFIAILAGIAAGVTGGVAALGAGQIVGLAPEVVTLMLYFALWVAIANAASAQKGILIWLGRIRTAAMCEIAGEGAALVTALIALQSGAGVFALVYGRIAAQSVSLSCSFLATRRLPLPGLPRDVLRELWIFSAQIFSARMLVHLRLHFITLIVGGLLGPVSAGLFRAADRLVGALAELVGVPGQVMAWTLLRRARDNGDAHPDMQNARINAQLARLLYALVMLGAPLFLWAMLMNTEIVRGLLGPEWAACAPLIAILALGRLFLLLGIVTEPLMSLMGQARRMPGFMAGIFVVSIALTLVAAPFGLLALAWSQVVVSATVLVATVWLFSRYAEVRWSVVARPLASAVVTLACGAAVIAALNAGLGGINWPDLVKAVTFGLAGGLVSGLVAVMINPAILVGLRRNRQVLR